MTLSAAAEDVDLILVDLVDERGGVIDVGAAYVTKLSEFWIAGGQRLTRGMQHHKFGSNAHFELWRQGADRFVEQLKGTGLLERTLVLRTPWADRYDDNDALEIPDWMIVPAEADRLYRRYFKFLESKGLCVVELPGRLAKTTRDHQWGPSPFHYTREAYENLVVSIRRFAGSDGPVLSRRDTSTWGDFVDFAGVYEFAAADNLPARLTVWQNGFPVDLMVEANDSQTTLVSLGGQGLQGPMFAGRALSAGLGMNRVFVSDPGLLTEDSAGEALYLGTDGLDLTDLISSVIRIIQTKLGADHLVFYGVDAGGFAALNLSHAFHGSLAVPVNPQTCVVDDQGATAVPLGDLRGSYSKGQENWVIYLQNSREVTTVRKHMIPWLQALDGLGRLALLLEDWDPNAKGPPAALMRRRISGIADVQGDWPALAKAWGAQVRPSRVSVVAAAGGIR